MWLLDCTSLQPPSPDDLVLFTEHPKAGTTKAIGLPIKFGATPGRVTRAAPLFGQHTREVCREAGFSDAEIDAMIASGAVAESTSASRAA